MRNFVKPSVFIYDYKFSKAKSFLAQMTIVYIFVFISSVYLCYVEDPNMFSKFSIIEGLLITY